MIKVCYSLKDACECETETIYDSEPSDESSVSSDDESSTSSDDESNVSSDDESSDESSGKSSEVSSGKSSDGSNVSPDKSPYIIAHERVTRTKEIGRSFCVF